MTMNRSRARGFRVPLALGGLALSLAIVCEVGVLAHPVLASGGFSSRPLVPRVAPLPVAERDAAQKEMLASRPDFNIYTTLARHVALYNRWSPLGRYLLNASSLPARDREIVMLRMGWLCQSEYEWSQHARIAIADAGLTSEDVVRIAEGPAVAGWGEWERTLMVMVDELRYDARISDATWAALRVRYSEREVMDALFTAGQYQLVSMVLNSLGIQLDPVLEHRLPRHLPAPSLAVRPSATILPAPRVGSVAAHDLGAALSGHPLVEPLAGFTRFLETESALPERTSALLFLRTAWLLGDETAWARQVPRARAAGLDDSEILRVAMGPEAGAEGDGPWSPNDRAVLRAADELRREAFLTDATWAELARELDTKQMVEVVYTVGGATLTSLAVRSFGIQLAPGALSFPMLVD